MKKYTTYCVVSLLIFSLFGCVKQKPLAKQPVEDVINSVAPIIDNSQVIPNPNKVPTITFTDPNQYPQKTFPIKWYYPVDPAVHPSVTIYPEYFIAAQGADGFFSYSRKTGKLATKYLMPPKSGYSNDFLYKNFFFYSLTTPDQIRCHRMDNGKLVWEKMIDEKKSDSETLDYFFQSIVFCNDDFVLIRRSTYEREYSFYYALDLQTGNLIWKLETPSSFALDDHGFLIFYTEGKLVKYNIKTNKIVWKSPDLSIPTELLGRKVSDNYLSKIDGQIILYDTPNGFNHISSVDGSVVRETSHLNYADSFGGYQFLQYQFILSRSKLLTCYDIKTLKELWKLDIQKFNKDLKISDSESSDFVYASIDSHQNKVYVSLSRNLHGAAFLKSYTYCINPENGKVDWIKPYLIDHFVNGYGIRENKIQDESAWEFSKSMTIIDLKDGNEVWNFKRSEMYYCNSYIPLKNHILFEVGRSENGMPNYYGLLKISYDGKVEALYTSNIAKEGFIGGYVNRDDKTSFFFDGDYKNKSCYYEVEKSVFGE